MIRDLSIKNYRCFEDFCVDGLAQVNLIVGDNNTGKTSLLEAIYILLDKSYYYKFHTKTTTLINLLKLRKEFLSLISEDETESKIIKIYLITHLFNKNNINKTIEIFCDNDFFSKVQITNLKPEKSKFKNIHLLTTDDEYFKVNYEFKKSNTENKNIRGQAFYEINQQGIYIQETPENANTTRLNGIDRLIMYTPDSIFMPLNYDYLNDVEKNWDLIQLTPKEDKVIEALQIINPNIERIGFTVSQYTKQIRLKIKGEDQPIPLSSMGQGMNRILGLITTAVILENGVLLIDEIETGLHYKAQTDMWRLLIKTAQELNVQIFATTHSWDCICAFQEALEDIEDQSVGNLFRLDNKYGKLRAVEYKADEVSIAVDQGIEVR